MRKGITGISICLLMAKVVDSAGSADAGSAPLGKHDFPGTALSQDELLFCEVWEGSEENEQHVKELLQGGASVRHGLRRRVLTSGSVALRCASLSVRAAAVPNASTALTPLARKAIAPVGASNSTALHAAAGRGNSRMLRILMDAPGADIDIRTDEDWTPLHIAAALGKVNTCADLLNAGADPTLLNKENNSAFEIAMTSEHSNSKVVDLLNE